jgi:dTDP-4-dehydrorhamnose reductase/adenine/guanine phosphoribosyltransferase-like PRPP-binding protein
MKKVLIINKSGFIGSGIHEALSATYVVGGVSESGEGQNTRALDVEDKHAVNNFFRNQSFDIVVYCPERIHWEDAADRSEAALERKVTHTRNIVNAVKEKHSKFIYVSSKEVYGGDDPPYTTDSERSPVNHRGKACLQSECVVQEKLKNYCIIRPGNVYGFTESHGYDRFTQCVLDIDESTDAAFDDEVVEYPTLIDDLVDLVRKIIDHDLTSNYNISSKRGVTNYEWTKLVREIHGMDTNTIVPRRSTERTSRPYNVEFDLDSITNLGLSMRSVKEGLEVQRMQNLCTFRPIYIQDLTDSFGDASSSAIRQRLGATHAERDNVDADAVVPIPQSGIYPASGYANGATLPLKFALSKQNLRHRTLYDTGIERGSIMDDAMRAIPEMIADKSIVVVDEALLSGTTVRSVIPKLRDASEIHLRISSPPVVRHCPAGIHPESTNLMIEDLDGLDDADLSAIEDRLADELEITSVRFVPTDVYNEIVRKPDGSCTHCFV